jgi:DNA-binding helix-hairpin-helix protein with protein kinase domain
MAHVQQTGSHHRPRAQAWVAAAAAAMLILTGSQVRAEHAGLSGGSEAPAWTPRSSPM